MAVEKTSDEILYKVPGVALKSELNKVFPAPSILICSCCRVDLEKSLKALLQIPVVWQAQHVGVLHGKEKCLALANHHPPRREGDEKMSIALSHTA